MKFGYTIIYVPDVVQTVEFYERAFGLRRSFIHEANDYAELSTGKTTLAFVSEVLRDLNGIKATDNRREAPPAGMEIAWVTEAVQEAYERAVSAGAEAVKPPEQKPWGQMVSYVRDLNGILVEICSPVKG